MEGGERERKDSKDTKGKGKRTVIYHAIELDPFTTDPRRPGITYLARNTCRGSSISQRPVRWESERSGTDDVIWEHGIPRSEGHGCVWEPGGGTGRKDGMDRQ